MSSPVSRFSSWRGRSAAPMPEIENADNNNSINQHQHDGPGAALGALTSGTLGESRHFSSSYGSSSYREPIRSFVHGTVRDKYSPIDTAQHARSVREDTAELASYLLSDHSGRRGAPSFLNRPRSNSSRTLRESSHASQRGTDDHDNALIGDTEVIEETTEPPSPMPTEDPFESAGPSIISNMLRHSPPEPIGSAANGHRRQRTDEEDELSLEDDNTHGGGHLLVDDANHEPSQQVDASETTPLLGIRSRESVRANGLPDITDLESQKPIRSSKSWRERWASTGRSLETRATGLVKVASDPNGWDGKAVWEALVVAPLACLPAVVVGLLLNILDALSYGMILFPLGNPIFSSLGPAGISIFYVSTIVSQLTFSTGSIFKGAVGSELIEVVPFFHSMASTITNSIGQENPDAVIATTILSYAISSVLTGVVFFSMGYFEFGYIVGFIPRHILVGCIGGVGWFLVATGFEVSARIDGSLDYNLDTLHKLMAPDTIPLWAIPLALGLGLFILRRRFESKYLLPCFILAIPAVFYILVESLQSLNTDSLRNAGWIFQGPASDEPWWYFYTLFKFHLVRWDALAETIPAMFALTFFGILHVPINVPALAMMSEEDDVDLNHELKLHGYSNILSGCCGSIQNYLVYANTSMFIRSGANTRLAGYELAALTFVIMLIGPGLIGYIPVMMVGCLIFCLGFDLMKEAFVDPRKKLQWFEYLTVVAIVLIMGIYDFVIGIGCGIIMAFITMAFQSAQASPVRAAWSGKVVGSTVRRNPSQQHYLKQVGSQIQVVRLAGFLFFGTIVGVESKIRALVADEAFDEQPIKFLVLDMHQVTGIDYSASEAFGTISRLLKKKNVEFILTGLMGNSDLSSSLRTVGVGEEVATLLPDLNSALEYCENELLKTLYAREVEAAKTPPTPASGSLEVPGHRDGQLPQGLGMMAGSPRRNHLYRAAAKAVDAGIRRQAKWQNFSEVVRLLLQIFSDMSDKDMDLWWRAERFFRRETHKAGDVLYRQGEPAKAFYLVESGIIRMEYKLPQGRRLCESIVAGTTCGELPFFSETDRTATAVVERDCTVWLMDRESWNRLQVEEPEVAKELMRLGFKMTCERMSVMTTHAVTLGP